MKKFCLNLTEHATKKLIMKRKNDTINKERRAKP